MKDETVLKTGLDLCDFPILLCENDGQILFKNKALRSVDDFRRCRNIKERISDSDASKIQLLDGEVRPCVISERIIQARVRKRELCHSAFIHKRPEGVYVFFFRLLQFIFEDSFRCGMSFSITNCFDYVAKTLFEYAESGRNLPESNSFLLSVPDRLDRLVRFTIEQRRLSSPDFDYFDCFDGIAVLRSVIDAYMRADIRLISVVDRISNADLNMLGRFDGFEKFISSCCSLILLTSKLTEGQPGILTLRIYGSVVVLALSIKRTETEQTPEQRNLIELLKMQNKYQEDNGSFIFYVPCKTVPVSERDRIGAGIGRPGIFRSCDAELSLALMLFLDVFGGLI